MREVFGNQSLLQAVSTLLPEVEVEGQTLRASSPAGFRVVFSEEGDEYRAAVESQTDSVESAAVLGAIRQEYARLQIEQVAGQSGFTVAEERRPDGTITIGLAKEDPSAAGERVTAELDARGDVVVEAHGVKGRRCVELIRPFADAVGTVREAIRTREYYETAQAGRARGRTRESS